MAVVACMAIMVVVELQLSFGAVEQQQQQLKPSKQPKQDGGGAVVALPHFEPMVALFCPDEEEDAAGGSSGQLSPYYNKYMSPGGQWLTDVSAAALTAACPLKDKTSILAYCKKVYPEKEITNIVESGHYIKLTGWCRRDSSGGRCDASDATSTFWVKPFRCLEGPFQSDALLVPEHCLFDHVHNQTRCSGFDAWNRTATDSCRARGMGLKSFGMLLPCGIDLFSGVEFVCCPRSNSNNKRIDIVRQNTIEVKEDKGSRRGREEDDYYVDEEDTYFEEELKDDPEDGDNDDDDDYAKEEYVETTEVPTTTLQPTTTTTTTTEKSTTTKGPAALEMSFESYLDKSGPIREQMEFVQEKTTF
jgi:amyloid beta A4 protein